MIRRLQRHFQAQYYCVAVISVLVAVLLTYQLWHQIQPALYPFFLAAVMISCWYGGLGPGLLATMLSTVFSEYFFLFPLYSLASTPGNLFKQLYFISIAFLICFLTTRMRSAQHRAEIHARAVEKHQALLQQNQEILWQSEERYRLLVEGVTDYAILMLDPDGNIVSWNTGAERILGYQEEEIVGQPFAQIFTPESIQQDRPRQILQEAVTQGWSTEHRWHIRKDGTQIWTYCVVAPLWGEAHNLRGFSKIMQDITARKQHEEERDRLLRREQAAREEAEAANRSKDEFLAILSHELRTPLTMILGWIGMLRTGRLDESRTELALETIQRNSNLQMLLIEDLLNISRIIRGDLVLNCHVVDLAEAIQAAIDVMQPAADSKEIQLEFILDPASLKGRSQEALDQSAFQTWGDSERLQQVMCNLLSNAIKFTPEGGQVEIRLEAVTDEQALVTGQEPDQQPITDYRLPITHYAQITVTDTGIGISADFLPHVFDRFRQADSTSTRLYKGLGLGLAIVRHLVELHEGTVQAESPGEGQGTTFRVRLPLLQNQESSRQPTNDSPLPIPHLLLPNLRVLVVDDETDMQEWLRAVFQVTGAEVVAVGSVAEALAVLETFQPDVLVSDIAMPGKDGNDLIREVRERETQVAKPILAIALSAYASVGDDDNALSAGFQHYLSKPAKADELIAAVADLVHRTDHQEGHDR
ncbi:MAG: response regulator [Elainellaceae cyanobacterium]